MLKRSAKILLALLPLLLFAAGAGMQSASGAEAREPTAKTLKKERKRIEKQQRKQQREEIRYYESLRNDAVLAFAETHQPTLVSMPFGNFFSLTDIVCAGDRATGTVMLHFKLNPVSTGFRLVMGGSRNGTRAYADGTYYESDDLYGRVYNFTGGPEQIIVTLRGVPPETPQFDQVDISMGLHRDILNLVVMRNVPICWTESDRTIRNWVKAGAPLPPAARSGGAE